MAHFLQRLHSLILKYIIISIAFSKERKCLKNNVFRSRLGFEFEASEF